MMIIVCDYHPSWQQICWVDTATGETGEKKLEHATGEAEKFYRGLPAPALTGQAAERKNIRDLDVPKPSTPLRMEETRGRDNLSHQKDGVMSCFAHFWLLISDLMFQLSADGYRSLGLKIKPASESGFLYNVSGG